VTFNDGTTLDEVVVEYPVGHARRRTEGIPLLHAKFKTNLARIFKQDQQDAILKVSLNRAELEQMSVIDYMDLYVNKDYKPNL